MPRLNNHGTMRSNRIDLHDRVRFLHTNDTYHQDLIAHDATTSNVAITLPNRTGTILTHTPNDHITMDENKEIRFHNSNAKIYNNGVAGNLHSWAREIKIESNDRDLQLKANNTDITLNSNRDVIVQASDGEEFFKCSHSGGNTQFAKPVDVNATLQLDGEITSTAQFNQGEILVMGSGKELRFANSNKKIYNTGDDINIVASVVGASIKLEAPIVQLKASTSVKIVEAPLIPTAPTTTTYSGDDGSIPITSTLISIDAGGSARSGLRFAGAGTAGQIIIVHNVGGEKVTFHGTEATCLVKAIHANHDTMEPASVYMFVSTGSLWCIIGGGKGSGTQLVAS